MTEYDPFTMQRLTIADLEFENGKLVKVCTIRPEYMSGNRLIWLTRELGRLLYNKIQEPSEAEKNNGNS